MKRSALVVLLMLAIGSVEMLCQQSAEQWVGWRIRKDTDPMSSVQLVQIETLSVPTGSEIAKAPPAKLAIQCGNGKVEIAVYTLEPVMPMGLFGQGNAFLAMSRDAGKNQTNVRIRLDEQKPMPVDEWIMEDSTTLKGYREGKYLTKKILRANKLLFEYKAGSGESRVVAFQVGGLKDVIAQSNQCGKID